MSYETHGKKPVKNNVVWDFLKSGSENNTRVQNSGEPVDITLWDTSI